MKLSLNAKSELFALRDRFISGAQTIRTIFLKPHRDQKGGF
jgi:hypothetical protein